MGKRFDTDKYESGYIPLYLERVRSPRRILEVGVKNGGSLLLWCDLWPSVQSVIGLDIRLPVMDWHPKISLFPANQTDTQVLQEIGRTQGPFDLVIDDASHIGESSWTTFRALWPYVAFGGMYVVEDWGTGYSNQWPDGSDYVEQGPPGHTAGMVGMIKRLVDELDHGQAARLEILSAIAFVYKGF